jgi:PAS domain S-box-containing protein
MTMDMKMTAPEAQLTAVAESSHGAAPGGGDLCFRSLVEEASDVLLVVQRNGALAYVSPAIRTAAGYEPQELTGRSFIQFIHPEDAPSAIEVLERAKVSPNETTVRMQLRYRHGDGSWRYADTVCRNLLNRPGIRGVVVNLRDVTDRVQAEQARRESDSRLSKFIEQISDVVLISARDGTIEYVSPALQAVAGFEPQQVKGRRFLEFIHPQDEPAAAVVFGDLLAQPSGRFRTVWRCRHKDGSWRLCEVTARNCLDVPGVDGVVISCRDVTERRNLDQARRDGDAMLKAITRSAKDAVILIDHDGRIAFWNHGAVTLCGWPQLEALGMDFTCLILPEKRQFMREDFQFVRQLGSSPFTRKIQETTILTRSGEQVPVEMTLTPVRLKDKWNLVLTVHDITERELAKAGHRAHTETMRQDLVAVPGN